MAISYNSTSLINEQSGSSSTLSWAHTCNAIDTKLIVVVGGRASISGVTYNGVAMALIANQFDTYQYNAVYYLDNPPTGSSYNIVATYSGSNQYREGLGLGLSGATSGIGAIGTSVSDFGLSLPRTITSTITTTVNGSEIMCVPGANDYNGSYLTFGAGQNTITKNTAANWGFWFQNKTTTTAGSYSSTVTNTVAQNNITLMSFELKVAGGMENIARRRLLVS